MRLTELGWWRSGVTGDGRGVRVMGGGVEDGGRSHDIEEGIFPSHSCISLMNSQSMS